MENGPPTFGLEDGTIDVERLLVEPQDGHVSVDSVICFNKKISENAMDMKDISQSFGTSLTGIAQEGEDVINGEVLDATPGEDEVGYFRYHDDFCSMGEEYLLGYEFAESITNLDYGSSEGLQDSIPDSQMQSSSAGSDTTCKSDLFRITDQFNIGSNELRKIPSCHEQEMLVDEKPSISPRSSHTLQNDNSSICTFQDILSEEMLCSRKTEKVDQFEQKDAVAVVSIQLPTQKRSRKPTQRYIDELTDPIPTYSKKKREVSSSTHKVKSLGIKDHKKRDMGSRAIKLPALEEFSVPAIQVPFGSLVHKECPETHAYDVVQCAVSRNPMSKSKGKHVIPEYKRKRDNNITTVNKKTSIQKKRDEYVPAAAQLSNSDGRITAKALKKRKECFIATTPNKKDDRSTSLNQTKNDDLLTAESYEELNVLHGHGRRKHHRLWTIAEVKKLIDGVSQYGVGRWSRIKKLLFASSAHRTSVDLKDKWRNLLKASGIQEQGNHQGEKKRNMAWRPLPKSILRRVCELARMHPYPKGQRLKIEHNNISDDDDDDDDSPDRNADITLGDYRRILRSINAN